MRSNPCCRLQFPLSMFLVAGSQADRADKNKLTILKLSDLHKTQVHPGTAELPITMQFEADLTVLCVMCR